MIYILYIYTQFVQMERDSASNNADFPELVSAMRLPSTECLKCVQVTYLTSTKCSSLSNEISAQSAENATQGDMYLISIYKRLQLNIRKI